MLTPLTSAHAADAVAAADDQPAADEKGDEGTPLIAIEGEAELQLDSGLGKPHTAAIYATVEPEITVNLSDTFRLFGHFVYEPVGDPIDGRFNAFHGEGLYAEELYAGLTVGNVKFALGKINPFFGIATDEAPGLYGQDFASEYDFKGALGQARLVFPRRSSLPKTPSAPARRLRLSNRSSTHRCSPRIPRYSVDRC
jgi:hypothetical protein